MKRVFLDNPEIETAMEQIKVDLGFKTDSELVTSLIRERAINLTILPAKGAAIENEVKQFNG